MLMYTVLSLLLGTVISAEPSRQVPLFQQNAPSLISISSSWDILGPFQIGTRGMYAMYVSLSETDANGWVEATWGADPLEQFGGFRNLYPSSNATFHSSLTTNGTIQWSSTHLKSSYNDAGGVRVDLNVSFLKVDWPFLQSVYGWAALQWQAWARSTITVEGDISQTFLLYTGGILEFWLDGEAYFGGDYYSFRKAPVVLALSPGKHQLDVRLIRDVRVMGGIGEPVIDVVLELLPASQGIEVDEHHLLVSDVVDGVLASPWASVPVRNTGEDDLLVTGVVADQSTLEVSLLSDTPLVVRPGQTRSISMAIECRSRCPKYLGFTVTYKVGPSTSQYHVNHLFNHKSTRDVHKFTFEHPAGIISYAMLRVPLVNSTSSGSEKLPILLNLHGAGLEADSPQLTTSLDPVQDLPAYTLFPTGGTPWSGDDWHHWGWTDVEAAIQALTLWRGEETQADTARWLIAGHSNGGQGVWHALTHHPDNVIAAVPISGYLSIQKYVPYSMWHEADPARTAVVQASLASYRHELLISNAKGIPLMQEHGGIDDNVPAYHSRRMTQLINESGWHSDYYEVPGENHWFPGVMTTSPLQHFYRRMLVEDKEAAHTELDFILITANPGDTRSKHGFLVEHLVDPGRLGKLNVKEQAQSIVMTTTNIEQFRMPKYVSALNKAIVVDGHQFDLSILGEDGHFTLRPGSQRQWQPKYRAEQSSPERHGYQLGRLDAILHTQGRFAIKGNTANARNLAVQISRNLFQYFGADTEILAEHDEASGGNFVTVIEGENIVPSNHPISILNGSISLRDDTGTERTYASEDTGVIFLRPLEKDRLELVIWGDQKSSLVRAARMMPMMPGVGQPEFIVLSRECSWNGIEGVLAMGFFDRKWNVSRSSFVT